METSKDVAKPALVFTTANEAGVLEKVHVWVPNAPVAAMEAELFYGSGPPSAFERRWLRDEAVSIKSQRCRVGGYIHSRGLNTTPQWLFEAEDSFHVVRPGAMTLLRLRKPVNDMETEALNAVLSALPLPSAGISDWKTLSIGLTPTAQVDIFTVFSSHGVDVVPRDEESSYSIGALNRACISGLALLVLKYARDVDYYNTDEDPHADITAEDGKPTAEDEDEDAANVSTVVDGLLLREESDASVEHLPPSLRAKNDTLAFALKATTKLNDVNRICFYSTTQKEPIEELTASFFHQSDSEIICNTNATYKGASEMLEVIGRMMCPRQAILCVRKDAESTYQSFLYTRHGKTTIGSLDQVTRLLFFSWVTPLLLDRNARGSTFFEIKVQGIRREQLSVSHAARLKAARNTTQLPPELASNLNQIPELVGKLKAAEGKFEQTSKALEEAKNVYAAGSSDVASVAVEVESETVRGFKRVVAAIEDYEASLRNVRPSR